MLRRGAHRRVPIVQRGCNRRAPVCNLTRMANARRNPTDDVMMTTNEVCAFCGVDRTTLFRWRRRGTLTAYTIPGTRTLRYRRSEVEALAVPIPVPAPALPRRNGARKTARKSVVRGATPRTRKATTTRKG